MFLVDSNLHHPPAPPRPLTPQGKQVQANLVALCLTLLHSTDVAFLQTEGKALHQQKIIVIIVILALLGWFGTEPTMSPRYARAKSSARHFRREKLVALPSLAYFICIFLEFYPTNTQSRGGTWLETPGIKRKSDVFIPASKNYSLVGTG